MFKERTRLELRIEKSLKEEFKQLCDEKGLNKSLVIRELMTKYIEDNK